MVKRFIHRWNNANPAFRLAMYGMLLLGVTSGIQNATFNNYLHDVYSLTSTQRGLLEFPRELPGFLLIFVTAVLASYSCRIWAVFVCIATGVGMLGLGYFSSNYITLVFWLLIWSTGEHLYLTVESTLGLTLAKTNAEGRKLGQVTGARNLAMIAGTIIVWLGFDKLGLSYPGLFLIAFICAVSGSFYFYRMKMDENPEAKKVKFVFKRKYGYFYCLNVLFGIRKQLFITFSPWVFVSIFGTQPQTIALLIMIASLAGFIFRQQFGEIVDKYGERSMLCIDAIILIGICIGFATIKNVYILYVFYIIDNLMFATRIARTTYLNKIADKKEEIAPTISLGITMDHGISMLVPFLGGLIWAGFGYPAVFITAGFFAIINLIIAAKIRIERG